jgi:hypothetical protein
MNKKFLPVLVLLALSMVFAGCVFEVEGEVVAKQSTASAPSKVNVVKGTDTSDSTTTYSFVVLTWDASNNASTYYIYYQRKPAKTITGPDYNAATNSRIYSTSITPTTTYDYSSNNDPDKWTARLYVNKVPTYPAGYTPPPDTGAVGLREGSEYRFGVSAVNPIPNQTNSDIKWSDWIQL